MHIQLESLSLSIYAHTTSLSIYLSPSINLVAVSIITYISWNKVKIEQSEDQEIPATLTL